MTAAADERVGTSRSRVRVRRVANHDPKTLEWWVSALLADLDPDEVIRVGDISREEADGPFGAVYACTIVYRLTDDDRGSGPRPGAD